MVIQPKIRGFFCTNAHPVGCKENVRRAADYAAKHKGEGPRRVLVLGASTGYGLAGRIFAAFGWAADTIGVFLEREPAGSRTASAGWYNNKALEEFAGAAGRVCTSINGDAFSDALKRETIAKIKSDLPCGQVDLIIYSLAAPRRTDPQTGEIYSSAIKPIGQAFCSKTVDFHTGQILAAELESATSEEIAGTVAVMGGTDWLLWMQALSGAGVIAPGAATVALSYIGPELTHPIYKDGTIGKAKEDLEKKAKEIDSLLSPLRGKAFVSVNKALVTQASAAIPVVPLYISLLYRVMKDAGTHEDCTQQMARLMRRIYSSDRGNEWAAVPVDECGRIRMDDLEMAPEIQAEISRRWAQVNEENLDRLADLQGYRKDFLQMFGFEVDGVDYTADVPL